MYTRHLFRSSLLVLWMLILLSCDRQSGDPLILTEAENQALKQAQDNGALFNQGLERCRQFVTDWLAFADPNTGLIPRNLYEDKDIWNAKDAAADNYPFMVLTAALTDQDLLEGRMLEMLERETQLTSRVDRLPDTYSFAKKDFDQTAVDMESILFGASEYIKDGLLPLTEWLGASPWSERMIGILDDMWKHALVETAHGNIVSTNVEVNGEMLQVLARIYWMTGEKKYLDWAIRLGDYYLLGAHHPSRDFTNLRLRDHGCEIVAGLCELYVTLSFTDTTKKKEYMPYLHTMLDRVLEVGRNQDGLFYNAVNPQTGAITVEGVADNFGYVLNGFYAVYQIDSVEAYRTATLKGLSALNDRYRNFDWERGSADGYADAIEGALNLYAREPVESTADWIDSEIQVMWSMQDSSHRHNTSQWQGSGIIEGWHGDGNFARTTIMYCLWKSQGITAFPWRSDLEIGAVSENDKLYVSVKLDEDWKGTLQFDAPRHRTYMNMPLDWPRINQFPEWFTAESSVQYTLLNVYEKVEKTFTGPQLIEGIPIALEPGIHQFMVRLKSN